MRTSDGIPTGRGRRLRFYWREIVAMRHFRRTHTRPDHLAPWKWRALEYRFAWALTKRVLRP